MLRHIFNWTAIVLYTFIASLAYILVSLVAPGVTMRYIARPWARLILFTCRVRLRTEGLEKLEPMHAVLMFNHQSYFDIFAMAAAFPIEWRSVMKKELASVPMFGLAVKLAGHYFVSRDVSVRSGREMNKVIEGVRTGFPVAIAPEGTRSADGKLQGFRPGGFMLALKAGVPIVPIVITGGLGIMHKSSTRIRPGAMELKVLDRIETSGLPQGKPGRVKLSEMVREVLQAELDRAAAPS